MLNCPCTGLWLAPLGMMSCACGQSCVARLMPVRVRNFAAASPGTGAFSSHDFNTRPEPDTCSTGHDSIDDGSSSSSCGRGECGDSWVESRSLQPKASRNGLRTRRPRARPHLNVSIERASTLYCQVVGPALLTEHGLLGDTGGALFESDGREEGLDSRCGSHAAPFAAVAIAVNAVLAAKDQLQALVVSHCTLSLLCRQCPGLT